MAQSDLPLPAQLGELLIHAGSAPVSDDLPGRLVQETNAWAVGLWRKKGTELRLCVFAAAEGFDETVAKEFTVATRRVPLDQTQLGIVNAVVHNRPALARAEELTGDLQKSAGWLGRFGARCSLSCPVMAGEDIIGVFAVSWKDAYQENDAWPQELQKLADAISMHLTENT
ncbi:GAF domain-containing protein [Rubinisphaera margarita]|uniref:GAF domain-containing protein n=1 Tax=Rubinisphaera margarita TaxID=2909586 RepID=UPI001EE8E8F3|nr:GAF domain-containing protein [Rubinisphaera margarita]MCG6154326.1 hypothetical protein [Rubinisphaera margarita]